MCDRNQTQRNNKNFNISFLICRVPPPPLSDTDSSGVFTPQAREILFERHEEERRRVVQRLVEEEEAERDDTSRGSPAQ